MPQNRKHLSDWDRAMEAKLLIAVLLLCATSAFAGPEWTAIATSKALYAEIELLMSECSPARLVQFHDDEEGVTDWKRECSETNAALVKRLNKLAQFGVSDGDSCWNEGSELQARAARFYAKLLQHFDSPELKKYLADKERTNPADWLAKVPAMKVEIDAIAKERKRLLKADAKCTPARAGLLSDESIEFLLFYSQQAQSR
jgi:hypothetical protein